MLVKILETHRLKALYVFTLILFVPAILILFTNSYLPGWDESYQLNAGVRFFNGLGLNNLIFTNNLSQNTYTYLSHFPPAYSVLIYSLLTLGFSIGTSAKIIKVTFLLLGLFFWLKLSLSYIKSYIFQILFLIILSRFYQMFLLFFHTDYIILSLFPTLIILFERIKEKGMGRFYSNLLFLSGVCAIAIAFKYSAIVLTCIIAALLFISLFKNKVTALKSCIVFSILPILSYGLIYYLNFTNSFSGSDVSTEIVSNSILKHINYIPDSILTFFNFIITNAIPGINALFSSFTFGKYLIFIIFSLTIVFLFRGFSFFSDSKFNVKTYFLVCTLISFIFFGFLSIFISQVIDNKLWWPIVELRYYSYLIPLFSILLFCELEKYVKNKGNYLAAFFIAVLIIIMSFINVNKRLNDISNKTIYQNRDCFAIECCVNQISIKYPQVPFKVFGYDYFPLLRIEDRIPVLSLSIQNVNPSFFKECFFSKNTLVFFVYSHKEIEENPSFLKFITTNGLHKYESEEYCIFWKLFHADNTFVTK